MTYFEECKTKFFENNVQVFPARVYCKVNKKGLIKKKFTPHEEWKIELGKVNEDFIYTHNTNTIAIKTGFINNITVVDIDFKDQDKIKVVLNELGLDNLESTPCIETRQGYHLYFNYKKDLGTTEGYGKHKFGDGIDIRNDGACIISPPSHYMREGEQFKYKVFGENADFDTFIEEITGDGIMGDIPDSFLSFTDVAEVKKTIKVSTKTISNQNILTFKNADFTKEITKEHQFLLNLIKPSSEERLFKMVSVIKRLNYSIDVLEKWASTSDEYNPVNFKTYIEPKWKNGEKYEFNEGTLHFFAKQDNPSGYNGLKNSLYNKVVTKFMNNRTDTDMAILFSEINTNVVCVDDTKKKFYIPNKYNKWEEQEKPFISNKLSFDLYDVLNTHQFCKRDELKKLETAETPDEKKIKDLQAYIKIAQAFTKQTRTNKFKNTFISEIASYTYDKSILNKLDETNLYLINFDNGAYDLKNSEFRLPNVDEYASKSTGFDYTDTIDDDIRQDIFTILNKIYKTENGNFDIRDYNINTIASCLCGYNKFENFYVWTGAGGNGKGLVDNLCKHSFGEYYDTISSDFFTNVKKSSSQASPEIADKRGIRMLVSSECKKEEEFQSSTLKLLSGNDDISTRKLYENQFRFRPQFTMFFQCNGCPNLSSVDRGVKRRFRLVEHPVQFVTKPNADVFYEEKMDTSIKEKFDTDIRYRQQFMLILIEYYNKNIKNNCSGEIITPNSIQSFTKDYLMENDIVGQLFDEIGIIISNVKTDKILPKIIHDAYDSSETRQNASSKLSRNELYKLIGNYQGIRKHKFKDNTYFINIRFNEEKLKAMADAKAE